MRKLLSVATLTQFHKDLKESFRISIFYMILACSTEKLAEKIH